MVSFYTYAPCPSSHKEISLGAKLSHLRGTDPGGTEAPLNDYRVHLLVLEITIVGRVFRVSLELWGHGKDLGRCTDYTF